MITRKEIDNFIERIPPTPKNLQRILLLLNSGDLKKAAAVAQDDLALRAYLKNIVNKPAYGFSNEINEVSQIFGILGLSGSQQTVYNYIVSLLNPDKWVLFKLNSSSFYELQAQLSAKWEIILEHLCINDKNAHEAITLLPASIIVAEALFFKKIDEVYLLRKTKSLDYNTILSRLCGISLFDICELIAHKWGMNEIVSDIIQSASGTIESPNRNIDKLGKWMHLLLFYELSQPVFVNAGLNDFLDFHIDYVNDIYDEFTSVLEIV